MAELDSNIVLKAFATPQLDIVGTMRDAEDRRRQMMLQQRQDSDYARQQQAEQTSLARRTRAAQLAAQGKYAQADQEAGLGAGDFDVHKSIAALQDEHRAQVRQKFASAAPVAIQALQEQDPARRQAMIQSAAPSLVENGWKPEEIAAFQPTDANLQRLINDARTVDSAIAQYDASRKPVLVGEGQQMRLPDGTLVAEGAPKFHAVTTPAGGTTTIFGAPGGQGAPSSPIGPQIESTVSSFVPGVTVTSRQRSAAHNAEVGGVSDSYHISDNARDFVPPKGMSMSALASAVRAKMLGFDVINEGDHVHVEPSPGMGRRTGGTLTIKGQPKPVSAIPGGPDGEGAKALAGRGYRYKPDGTLEPIPGGPADLGDIEIPPPKEIAKRNAAYPKVAGSYRAATFDIDAQIKDLEKLKTHPGLDNIVGAFDGRLPAVLPNSAAASALLKKILARGQFRALQDMRNNSPTGGALGNVSDSENKTLRQSVAALDQTQDETAFRAAIDQYIDDLRHTKNNLTQTFEDTYAYRKQSSAPASSNGWGKAQVVR